MAAQPHRRTRTRRFDDADWDIDPPHDPPSAEHADPDPDELDQPGWSTYLDATRGPGPMPGWVVTDPRALDAELGVVKTGKEAELSLVRRQVPDGHRDPDRGVRACVLAAKRYRAAEHRLFHRDAGYLEGRRVRKSRETRAIRTRTGFGKQLIAQQWAAAEFAVLAELWQAGAAVPYPVQLLGTEIMMEFIGTTDPAGVSVAAPRLAETRPSSTDARDLYEQLVEVLGALARLGYTHGDLSAYNVLVDDARGANRLVLIDLPQVVDVVGNPQGFEYLRRDCDNITAWFRARGIDADATALYETLAASTR
ncbi:MAG TPA: RIO1 family regulatory kinase/ATPase [Ilumatobacter sp.]|nr:RIO1 family regulatory kinase/ATPase [Ilumatobacter sp.]